MDGWTGVSHPLSAAENGGSAPPHCSVAIRSVVLEQATSRQQRQAKTTISNDGLREAARCCGPTLSDTVGARGSQREENVRLMCKLLSEPLLKAKWPSCANRVIETPWGGEGRQRKRERKKIDAHLVYAHTDRNRLGVEEQRQSEM